MSQFSRRARWLNVLFPSSVAPRAQDPGRFSDDVSLIQPYDGGGFGLSAADDGDWWHFALSAVGAADDFVIFTVPDGFIFRWMAGDASTVAGNNPNGNFAVQAITPPFSGAIAASVNVIISGTVVSRQIEIPIVGPFSEIRFEYANGNAATQILARIYGALAPVGSNFNV